MPDAFPPGLRAGRKRLCIFNAIPESYGNEVSLSPLPQANP